METVQGTITRRMASVLDSLQDEFRGIYGRADFECKINALREAGVRSDRSSKLKKLFILFDRCGIKYERGRNNEYYENLVREADIPSFSEIEDRMMLALFKRYERYPLPEEYMRRIVDRLCRKDDVWENDSLRLRILKQFIKYGNYLADAGYGGRLAIRKYVKTKNERSKISDEIVLSELDDSVFDLLATATKEQKKPYGRFGLLKAADDLASGKFHTGGATRKSLYLFAMVYDMTFYSGNWAGGETLDYRTDIETNLFRDYYANNLMRYITKEYREGKAGSFERDPSGQGINYKNYAEMIYLYYISKDCSPQDKISLSCSMINRVREKQYNRGKIDTRSVGGTAFFKGLFTEDILAESEDEFEEFICMNYNCDTYDAYTTNEEIRQTRINDLEMESEQLSAHKVYGSVMEAMKRIGIDPDNCRYGLWFTDVDAFEIRTFRKIWDRIPDIDREKVREFMDLLKGINSFLKNAVDCDKSPATVTRTSIIAAYYYYYNAVHEGDSADRWKSYEELFYNFKKDIDPKLKKAYYQELNGKNIFDVVVTFSSYAYLNV